MFKKLTVDGVLGIFTSLVDDLETLVAHHSIKITQHEADLLIIKDNIDTRQKEIDRAIAVQEKIEALISL